MSDLGERAMARFEARAVRGTLDRAADLIEVRKGIGSLLWMLDNAANHDSRTWREFEAAAREDAKRALAALDRITVLPGV